MVSLLCSHELCLIPTLEAGQFCSSEMSFDAIQPPDGLQSAVAITFLIGKKLGQAQIVNLGELLSSLHFIHQKLVLDRLSSPWYVL